MNCLINQQGKIVECAGGAPHDVICRRKFGYDLNTFLLDKGGVRIRAGVVCAELIAIEYCSPPTKEQQRVIRKILRGGRYFTVVTEKQTVQALQTL